MNLPPRSGWETGKHQANPPKEEDLQQGHKGRKRGTVNTFRSAVQKQSDLDAVETARVGASCSRPSNQHNQGESPWRHWRSHQAMTLSLCNPSPELEPGEHCVCTRSDLQVPSRGTLLSGVETAAVWQGQPIGSPCGAMVGPAAVSEAAGEPGCMLCMVPASFSSAPHRLQLLGQG